MHERTALLLWVMLLRSALSFSAIHPEIDPSQRCQIRESLASSFGEDPHQRKLAAIDASESSETTENLPSHMKVYGELGLDAFVTIMDAVGVRTSGEKFLDIGAGDGYLVIAASLLYPRMEISRGVEIIPSLYKRSLGFRSRWLEQQPTASTRGKNDPDSCPCEFLLDNALKPTLPVVWNETTLAVCFATTWSRESPGRRLEELSASLANNMSSGARVVIVDGFLMAKEHGWTDGGELVIQCPDTAPYSIARLYVKN